MREVHGLSQKKRFGAVLVCAFAFFVANVNDGLGPIQAVYLVVTKDWSAGLAAVVRMIQELSSLIASPFIGDLLDKVKNQRLLLCMFIFFLSAANVTIIFSDNLWFLIARAVVAGVTGASVRPGIASLTLGIVGHTNFATWAARSQVATFAGTMVALFLAGTVSYYYYPQVDSLFIIFGIMGVAGVACICLIPQGVISSLQARSLEQVQELEQSQGAQGQATEEGGLEQAQSGEVSPTSADIKQPISYWVVLKDKNLALWFALVFLFHFTNAAVMPLLAQVVGKEGGRAGMIWASSLIIIASIISMVVSGILKRASDVLGWKAVIAIGWATNIPRLAVITIVMYFADNNKVALAATQVFDGISNAVNCTAAMVVTALLVHGSGRFGAAQGCVNMVWHTGIMVGSVVFGYVAVIDYKIAFLLCGGLVVFPLLGLMRLRLPSEPHQDSSPSSGTGTPASPPSGQPIGHSNRLEGS